MPVVRDPLTDEFTPSTDTDGDDVKRFGAAARAPAPPAPTAEAEADGKDLVLVASGGVTSNTSGALAVVNGLTSGPEGCATVTAAATGTCPLRDAPRDLYAVNGEGAVAFIGSDPPNAAFGSCCSGACVCVIEPVEEEGDGVSAEAARCPLGAPGTSEPLDDCCSDAELDTVSSDGDGLGVSGSA